MYLIFYVIIYLPNLFSKKLHNTISIYKVKTRQLKNKYDYP